MKTFTSFVPKATVCHYCNHIAKTRGGTATRDLDSHAVTIDCQYLHSLTFLSHTYTHMCVYLPTDLGKELSPNLFLLKRWHVVLHFLCTLMSPLGVWKIPMKFLQAMCLEHLTFLFRLSENLLSQMSMCVSEKGTFFCLITSYPPAVHRK